jgi:hypothetical protein
MNCLRNITSADVVQAIQTASRRIVFLAPGLDEATAAALGEAWQRLGPDAVSVILDIDAEVIRLGYGTEKGLEVIQKVATSCDQAVGHQPGVRICVVVVDERSLVFSPTPLLIEAGSAQRNRPNGIVMEATPRSLGDELGIGAEGVARREIGLEVVNSGAIQAVKRDLHDNPPLKFDISRRERVFNARLEFVEFELEGCFISRHTVTISPGLLGMATMDEGIRGKLRSSFRLVEESDVLDAGDKKISEKKLREERQRIGRKFLRTIKGYGTLILRSNREAFEKEVEGLRQMVETFRQALGARLEGLFEENAQRLTKALLDSVAENPPEDWRSVLGANPKREQVESMLHRTLRRAFGNPESLVSEMRVNLNFKGVTYGTLVDPKFIQEAREVYPNLLLHEEYDAARGDLESLSAPEEGRPA